MREVKPRAMPDGSVYYPNPPAKVLLALTPLCPIFGALIGIPYFLRVFTPVALIIIGIPLTVIVHVVFLLLLSTRLVLDSKIGQDYVELRYMFKRKRIHAEEVLGVEISPPVYSDSLEYRYWGEVDSVCTIKLRNQKRILLSLIPNGVKLRMARVLDPENFPSWPPSQRLRGNATRTRGKAPAREGGRPVRGDRRNHVLPEGERPAGSE
ncbi:MAG: hypothetical protein ACE5QF_09965 [Thermoplasmata archaeon]